MLPPRWALGAVAAGGAAGTAARYGLGQRFTTEAGTFPATTLVENIVGAALLAALVVYLLERSVRRHWVRPLLGAGLLGSFTTFSTFAAETVVLVDHGRGVLALGYVAATIVAGIVAAIIGTRLMQLWLARSTPPGNPPQATPLP